MAQISSGRRRSASKGPPKPPTKRQRLPAAQRERAIIEEAVHFFAQYGFEAATNELAERVGITQPLLFKYFPTKESLIERVYLNVFPGRWDDAWEAILADRSRSALERISTFYKLYSKVMLTYEVVRITLYVGLSRPRYTRRFYEVLRKRVFKRIVLILREEAASRELKGAPTEKEMEWVQALHGSIYHLALRKWVHDPPLKADIADLIDLKVELFLRGARAAAASG